LRKSGSDYRGTRGKRSASHKTFRYRDAFALEKRTCTCNCKKPVRNGWGTILINKYCTTLINPEKGWCTNSFNLRPVLSCPPELTPRTIATNRATTADTRTPFPGPLEDGLEKIAREVMRRKGLSEEEIEGKLERMDVQ